MLCSSVMTVLHGGQTAPAALLQASAAAWSLLLARGNSSSSGSSSGRALSTAAKRPARAGLPQHSQQQQQQQQQLLHHAAQPSASPSLWRALSSGGRLMRSAAPMSHAAALLTDFGSDEEAASGPAARRQQPSHQHPQQQLFKASAGPASQAQHGPAAAQPPAGGGQRYQGHLHAPHGRRHATTSQQTNVDRFISEQLLSCKSLGMLRRIQIKHKATMEAEHVADTLLALQHLVRTARTSRRGNGAGAGAAAHPLAHATSLARAQPRVRGDLGRSKPRSAESDGHADQLMAQMLGELGGAIWYQMGDMTGPDLAKVLYSWAMLDWHAEPELRADVKVSLLAAAAAADAQQQSAEEQEWLAAGLWGLAKLGEPFEGQVLSVLQQHWRQLLHLWTPQQLADVAAALVAVADEQVAASATAGSEPAAGDALTQHLLPLVSGLAQQLVQSVAHQQPGAGEQAGELRVPLPWPESMLVRVQQALNRPPAVDAGSGPAAAAAQPDDVAQTPLVPVHNVPHLAWCMLQALAAVGVNVSEPEDAALGSLVAALAAATKGAAHAA